VKGEGLARAKSQKTLAGPTPNRYSLIVYADAPLLTPPVLISSITQGESGLFTIGVASAVPEPSTWAIMLLGFAGLSFAFRRMLLWPRWRKTGGPYHASETLGHKPNGLGAIKTLLLGVAITVALLSISATAKANVVYDWQGTCTLGCTGTATGVLTLTDGASSFNFGLLNFISFEFSSSSGTFFLDNTSPYLAAQGGGSVGAQSVFLEENAFRPDNTYPLWQFTSNPGAVPTLTLSREPGEWQFLLGANDWMCLDSQCTTWTDNITRNVGVDGVYTLHVAAIPEPSARAMMLLGFCGLGFAFRQSQRKVSMA
jgi:PEP-CTERM motif